MSDKKLLAGTAAAMVVAAIWGLSFVAARMVLVTLSPLLLATLRFLIASIIFLPVVVAEARRGNSLTKRDYAELALLGFMSITIYFWLQYTGVKYAGAGVSALLVVGFIPIITGLASPFVLGEKITSRKAMGISFGFVGVALIALPKLIIGDVDLLFFIGMASLLSNALLFSIYSVLSRRLVNRVRKPLLVTSYTMIFGTSALIPLSFAYDWGLVGTLEIGQGISVLYLAIVCSCLGYFLWNFALSRLEAVKAAIWLYMEPVAAFVGEALIFSMMPSPTTLIGGVAIIAGAFITSRSSR